MRTTWRERLEELAQRAMPPESLAPRAETRAKPQFKVNRQRRRAQPEEVTDWIEIASKREPPRRRDKASLQNYLKAKNPWRWAALQRDLRWAERELGKLGMNPEDARWIV